MFNLGARLYLLLSNQLHYRAIQFSGSEWILSTPFDASLLTPEPPHGGSFFLCAGSAADPAHPAPRATGATRAAPATAGLGRFGVRPSARGDSEAFRVAFGFAEFTFAEDVHKARGRHTTVANQRA